MSNPPTLRDGLRVIAQLLAVVSTVTLFITLILGLPVVPSLLLTTALLWIAVGSL